MALPLLFSSPFSSSAVFATPYSSLTMAITAAPISRLHMKLMGRHLKSCKNQRFNDVAEKRVSLIGMAFSDTDGPVSGEAQSESDDEEYLPLNKLPLDSKLQLRLEQKMRMKFSKKIRLRRKKLVHKRRMRKRGRWPPSKMAKLKNV